MSGHLTINANALFRAATAREYRVLAHYLDKRSGEIVSRALAVDPREQLLKTPMLGKYCPEMLGSGKRRVNPVTEYIDQKAKNKKSLFQDDGKGKEDPFAGSFFQKDKKAAANPFGDHKKEQAEKRIKLAGLFADTGPGESAQNPFGGDTVEEPIADIEAAVVGSIQKVAEGEEEYLVLVPRVEEALWIKWIRMFIDEDVGDPEISGVLKKCLSEEGEELEKKFHRLLRRYPRTAEQWDRYTRTRTLTAAENWLSELNLSSWKLADEATTS